VTRKEKWITAAVLIVNMGLGIILMGRADLDQVKGNAVVDANGEPVARLDQETPDRGAGLPIPKD